MPVRDIARVILTAFEFPVESGEGTHGYAFFHRFPDRTIDESDITARTPVLADFIQATIASHCVTRAPVAIGFSNGAIMSAALLLMRPGLLAGAILFRPLSPFADNLLPGLDGTPVLIIDGEKDGRRSPGDGLRLAERLIRAGAGVMHHVLPVGHSITSMDREIAKRWLERFECSGAIPASTSPGI